MLLDRFQSLSLLGESKEREVTELICKFTGNGMERRKEGNDAFLLLLLYSIAVVLCVLYFSRQHLIITIIACLSRLSNDYFYDSEQSER